MTERNKIIRAVRARTNLQLKPNGMVVDECWVEWVAALKEIGLEPETYEHLDVLVLRELER